MHGLMAQRRFHVVVWGGRFSFNAPGPAAIGLHAATAVTHAKVGRNLEALDQFKLTR